MGQRPSSPSSLCTATSWTGGRGCTNGTSWRIPPRRGCARCSTTCAVTVGPAVRPEEPTICSLALHRGAPFAYLQCYRNLDYPEWANVIGAADGISIDLFIGDPAYLGRGFGQSALRAYLDEVAFPSYAGERRAYIGHELTNHAALRCSKAVCFQPWRRFSEDGVEMQLLATER